MNSIDAQDRMLELLVRIMTLLSCVRNNSDITEFKWTQWEADVDSTIVEYNKLLSAMIAGGLYGYGSTMGGRIVRDSNAEGGSIEESSGGVSEEGGERKLVYHGRGRAEGDNQ